MVVGHRLTLTASLHAEVAVATRAVTDATGPCSQVRCRAEEDGRRVTGADQHASQGRADYIVARACDASTGKADGMVATRAAADAAPSFVFFSIEERTYESHG